MTALPPSEPSRRHEYDRLIEHRLEHRLDAGTVDGIRVAAGEAHKRAVARAA